MKKIFYRYIAHGFWGPFSFGLGVFCLLLIFGSLFDKLNFFMRSGSGAEVLVRYILYQTPYFLVKMTPIATLLAVLFSLGGMISKGEWKAALAGGWRPFDMLKPLLICSVLAGAGQLLLQETAMPGFYMRSEYLFEGKMRSKQDWQRLVRRNVAFSAGGEVFVTAHLFDGHRRVMERVIVGIYKDGKLHSEAEAALAIWRPETGFWELRDGVMIGYSGQSAPTSRKFSSYNSSISVPPENLVLEKLVPDGISSTDLLRRLRRLQAVGAPSSEERTLFWIKLAAPLASPAMALIGAAIVLLSGRNNKVFSFGLALGIGFFFWALMIMAQAAGNAELVPPALAGFAPAAVFAAVSFWGLRRARAF